MAREAAREKKNESLLIGGMARLGGLDLYGPTYMSAAYRREGEIHVSVEPSNIWRPASPLLVRISRWPIVRSVFFWGRLVLQVIGSMWTFVVFAALLAGLWLFMRLMEMGSGAGAVGAVFGFFAEFPVLPLLLAFFAVMKFTSIGRYHGAEHKAVAAYEKYGEVTLENAKKSSRIHPRCGTNILVYILLATLLDPLVPWSSYAVLQFILISEAWYVFGRTRPSIAAGNFLQRYFTTTEPSRGELEVAVASLRRLLDVEDHRAAAGTLQVPARF